MNGTEEKIQFTVRGLPQAKGSTRAFIVKGKPVITSTNRNLKDWEHLVASEAQKLAPPTLWEGPVNLILRFYLPRPKTLPKKIVWHTKRPDLGKLARACEDALTGIIWRDDSQIVHEVLVKEYGDPPSVEVEIIK